MWARRAGIVGIVLAIAAALAACGSGGETVESTGASLAKVIRAAAQTSSASPGQKATMSERLDGQTMMHFSIDGAQDGSVATGEMQVAGGTTLQILLVGGSYYEQLPDMPPGKTWVQLAPADLQAAGYNPAGLQKQSSGQALAFLESTSDDVRQVGKETIDGVAATHYRLDADISKLAQRNGALSPALLEQVEGLLGSTLPMDVWIDGDQHVVRTTYSVNLAHSPKLPKGMPAHGTLSFQIDISDYGSVPTVTAPPAAGVMPFADYKQYVGADATGSGSGSGSN